MAEFLEESTGLESTTVGIYRTAATVQGGRRFSFGALVVVGDRNGSVAIGYGKGPNVPSAIEKAQKHARKDLKKVTLQEGTIPHEVNGRFCSSNVRLIPASPGTGVIAGATVRAVLEMAGVKDCLTKSFGANTQLNLAKAAMEGLLSMRSKQQIAELRGVELDQTQVEEKLAIGRRYAPTATPGAQAAKGPQAKGKKDDEKKSKGKGKGKGKGKSEAKGGKSGGGGAKKTSSESSQQGGAATATAEPEPESASQPETEQQQPQQQGDQQSES